MNEPQAVQLFLECDMERPVPAHVGPGQACVFSSGHPGWEGPNEDAAALISIDEQRCVLVLADGFGGHAAGARAAATAVRAVAGAVAEPTQATAGLIAKIVDGFEEANRIVREWGIGAATTLSAVAVERTSVRSFHVGDSAILVTGQRRRIKLRVIAHSPVGYAVESGLLDEQAALSHAERHVVSNIVGSDDMHIELGPSLNLALRDTVLIASDGLWDNLLFEEIVARISKGPLERGIADLAQLAGQRMLSPGPGEPSKADDLTLVGFRRG
jgi:serine/threonine protein phosphatase PrpC